MSIAWYERDPLHREYNYYEVEQRYHINNDRVYLLDTESLEMLATISYEWNPPAIYFDCDTEDIHWHSLTPGELERWFAEPDQMWMERLL